MICTLTDPYAGLEIPEALEQSLTRHREHLARLVATLRGAGVSDEQIELSVSITVESYKTELLRAIKELVR